MWMPCQHTDCSGHFCFNIKVVISCVCHTFVTISFGHQVKEVKQTSSGLEISTVTAVPGRKPTSAVIPDVDCLLWAIGRDPNSRGLNLKNVVSWCSPLPTFLYPVFAHHPPAHTCPKFGWVLVDSFLLSFYIQLVVKSHYHSL